MGYLPNKVSEGQNFLKEVKGQSSQNAWTPLHCVLRHTLTSPGRYHYQIGQVNGDTRQEDPILCLRAAGDHLQEVERNFFLEAEQD